jgi:hypothetical protein
MLGCREDAVNDENLHACTGCRNSF